MPGPWKAWKTKLRFPPLPPAPWKSRKSSEIPHFHRPSLRRMEKWKTKTRFPPFPRGASGDDHGFRLKTQTKRKEVGRCAASSLLLFGAHPHPGFHAHPSIRKCSGRASALLENPAGG